MKRVLSLLFAIVSLAAVSLVAAEPIVIGAIQDVSGPASVLGIASVNGHELAVKHINAKGGINGRPIKFINYDTKNDPNEAINAYKRLVQVDGAVAVLGPPVANIGLALQSTTSDLKTALVGSFADVRCTLGEKQDTLFPYMFIMQTTSDTYGQLTADYIYERFGGKDAKIGILYAQDHAFNASWVQMLETRAKELGVEISTIQANQQNDTEMRTQILNIINSGATIMFNGNPVQPAVVSQTQAYQLGLDIPTLGSVDFSIPFNTLVSDQAIADNIFFPTNVDFDDPALQDIRKEYIATYENEPTRFSYLGFDQITLVAEAIKKAGSADNQAVAKALSTQTKDVPLCSGVFSFDPKTHLPQGLSVVFYELKDGKYVNPERYGGIKK